MRVERLEVREMLSGDGLTGQYFHNADFTGLAIERVEGVNFNWGSSSPSGGIGADTFSVRWSGQVTAGQSQPHTFYVVTPDEVKLWVDGTLVIDTFGSPGAVAISQPIELLAERQSYDIRLEYIERSGTASVRLEWSTPTLTREVVPATRLSQNPAGLLGEYSDGLGNSVSRVDGQIDFNWGTNAPHPSLAAGQFDIGWTGQLRPDYSGDYTFLINSDEGVRLWIDNELIVDDWLAHTARTASGGRWLEAGRLYDVRLEYYNQSGPANISLMWANDSQTGGVPTVVPISNIYASLPAVETFENDLGQGQDPYVTRWGDSYLSVRSGGSSVFIDQAESLQNIHRNHPLSTTVTAWTAPQGTDYSEQIWAPEIHFLEGKWYIYVAASNGNSAATHRMHVLERDDPNPMGPYTYRGVLTPTQDFWAIDGTVLEWRNQLYFVWSGWGAGTGAQQNLYIAQMSDPLTISGGRTLISSPTFGWEQNGLAINEGPQILIHDGQLHIIYSASGFWTPNYALGRLTYNGVGSLLNASSWTKSPSPVFQQAGSVVGTGHQSFTTSLDGSEHWMVYHAHSNPDMYVTRVIYMQPFEFNSNNVPVFGQPIQPQTPLRVPGRGPDPHLIIGPGDSDASGVVDLADRTVWLQTYGQTGVPGFGADENEDGVVDAADYTVWRDNLGNRTVPTTNSLAYWRHEEGEVGQHVAASPGSVLDASGSGNTMQPVNSTTGSATYSNLVSPIPLRSRLPNTRSLDFGPGGDDPGRNDGNITSGGSLEGYAFKNLTVELAFRIDQLGGFQSLVGIDGAPTSSPIAPLQIKVRGDSFPGGVPNQLYVEWIDGTGRLRNLTSGDSIAANTWYHVAVVLTRNTAEFYLADESGPYELVDSSYGDDFGGLASEVLYATNGSFTVGRGSYNNAAADWADAHIDEVRISDARLDPSQFLFDFSRVRGLAGYSSPTVESSPALAVDYGDQPSPTPLDDSSSQSPLVADLQAAFDSSLATPLAADLSSPITDLSPAMKVGYSDQLSLAPLRSEPFRSLLVAARETAFAADDLLLVLDASHSARIANTVDNFEEAEPRGESTGNQLTEEADASDPSLRLVDLLFSDWSGEAEPL